ncbi:hypothetical protein ACTMU2_13875 [Cupriavidus basilensis]
MSGTMQPRATALAVLAELSHWPGIASRFPAWAAKVERLHGPDSLVRAAFRACHLSHEEVGLLAKELNGIAYEGRSGHQICVEKLLVAAPMTLPGTQGQACSDSEKQIAFNRLGAIRAQGLELQAQQQGLKGGLRFGSRRLGAYLDKASSSCRTDMHGYDQAIQLHVDALLAGACGYRVGGLFASNSFGDVTEVRLSQEMLNEIQRVQQVYWHSYILQEMLQLPEARQAGSADSCWTKLPFPEASSETPHMPSSRRLSQALRDQLSRPRLAQRLPAQPESPARGR